MAINKTILCLLITSLTCISSAAFAEETSAASSADENMQRSVQVMKKFDKDKDEKITEAEFLALSEGSEAIAVMTKRFNKFDANSDGVICYQELNRRFKMLAER